MNKPLTDRIIVLGVDGMDPKLTCKFMAKGDMPNLRKMLDRGSARADLQMLGGLPTVTPPMWTTLCTGANPETHGILAFNNPHPTKIDTQLYSLDSRMCKAEQLWNVFAEAGKKTLVWHWPGSSWPPTSNSPQLSVVDGVTPAAINMGMANTDKDTVIIGDSSFTESEFRPFNPEGVATLPGAGCIITDVDDILASGKDAAGQIRPEDNSKNEFASFVMGEEDTPDEFLGIDKFDYIDTPIHEPKGWADAPQDAKEFTIYTSGGMVRRPALILRNEQGVFDRIAIYKSKKDTEPLFVVQKGVYTPYFVDDVVHNNQHILSSRSMKILELAEDGSKIRLWMSTAYDIHCNGTWYPRTLLQDIIDHVGMVPPVCDCSGRMTEYVKELMVPSWEFYCQWQAKCLHYMVDEQKTEIIFSHLHNIDLCGHQLWHLAKHYGPWNNDEKFYQDIIEELYRQTDRYIGQFLHYLDEGVTLVLVSDHGLITEENRSLGLGEGGVNGTVMKDLGFTVFKKDEAGNDLPDLDLEKTTAVACRGFINLNLKSKYPYGIVSDEEKYMLEDKVISALYNYRDPVTGRRMVSLCLRAKDAAILGLNCPKDFDLVYFMEEGFNIIHMDSLSTQEGYFGTSVSPIFAAAGPGIKENCVTTRVIREVDVAPTLAVLGGVRMPAQCEGAPAYQILTEVY